MLGEASHYTVPRWCLHSYPLRLKEKLERMRGEPNRGRIPVAEPRTLNQLFFETFKSCNMERVLVSVLYTHVLSDHDKARENN